MTGGSFLRKVGVMEHYEDLVLEIISFEDEDVITNSPGNIQLPYAP